MAPRVQRWVCQTLEGEPGITQNISSPESSPRHTVLKGSGEPDPRMTREPGRRTPTRVGHDPDPRDPGPAGAGLSVPLLSARPSSRATRLAADGPGGTRPLRPAWVLASRRFDARVQRERRRGCVQTNTFSPRSFGLAGPLRCRSAPPLALWLCRFAFSGGRASFGFLFSACSEVYVSRSTILSQACHTRGKSLTSISLSRL